MTGSSAFTIQAVVSPGEQRAVEKTTQLLAEKLDAVSGRTWNIDCHFPASFEAIDRSDPQAIVITSFLEEADRVDEPWNQAQARIRQRYQSLCDNGLSVVFVCTVLRHINDEISSESASARRVRIRRLNLLAAELSREMGLYVIDIDRDLADIGARSLATDYRLLGSFAAEAAAKSMAMSLLLVGLDAFVPIETQEDTRDLVRAYQPPRAIAGMSKVLTPGAPAVAVRAGRRSQMIESTIDSVDENFVALYVQRLMKGQIRLRDAAAILFGLIRRRGLRASSARLFAGLKKAAGDVKLVKR